MNNINDYEKIEHKIINYLYSGGLTGRYDINDLYLKKDDTTIIGEFKTRRFHHTKYDWFIEKKKLKNLLKKASKEDNYELVYINYFSDGYIIIWDLIDVFKNHKPELKTIKMNKQTASGWKHSGKKINKEVYELKNEYAIKIIKYNE